MFFSFQHCNQKNGKKKPFFGFLMVNFQFSTFRFHECSMLKTELRLILIFFYVIILPEHNHPSQCKHYF